MEVWAQPQRGGAAAAELGAVGLPLPSWASELPRVLEESSPCFQQRPVGGVRGQPHAQREGLLLSHQNQGLADSPGTFPVWEEGAQASPGAPGQLAWIPDLWVRGTNVHARDSKG